MAIERWEPFRGLTSLRRELDRLFEDFFGRETMRTTIPTVWEPGVDVMESDDEVIVRAEVPGVKKEDLEVNFSDNTLSIRGESRRETEKKGVSYYRRELIYGSFSRQIPLPSNIQVDKAEARLEDGILEIKIPKAEKAKPKKIRIT